MKSTDKQVNYCTVAKHNHVREQAMANTDMDLSRKARHDLQWHMQGWPVSSPTDPTTSLTASDLLSLPFAYA